MHEKPQSQPRWPNPGDQAPPWRVGPLKYAARGLLRLFGWRIEGSLPNEKKLVLAVAPHTSNWDWVLCMGVLVALGLRIQWVAKDSMFRGLPGYFFRALGGVAVDRSGKKGFVASTVQWFDSVEKGWLAMAPEGTRRKVDRFKSGFFHIAREAGVPIVPVSVDYSERVLRFYPMVRPGEDVEQGVIELEKMLGFERIDGN